jgi:hypothetical protein
MFVSSWVVWFTSSTSFIESLQNSQPSLSRPLIQDQKNLFVRSHTQKVFLIKVKMIEISLRDFKLFNNVPDDFKREFQEIVSNVWN